MSLHEQALGLKISFEILVFDDCSPIPVTENEAINELSHARYTILPKNIGRSAIRNRLAREATYEFLLFLDADTEVIRADFLKKYLEAITTTTEIVYGGIRYQETPPKPEELLRWHYGKAREALGVEARRKAPHLRFLTLNFLIKKSVFDKIAFNEDIPNLRHEDTLFALDCKKRGISVAHIDNPVVHLGLENSEVFLRKSREAVEALHLFVTNGLIDAGETSLSKKAKQLRIAKLAHPIMWFYSLFKKTMERNLLSQNPSLKIFDLYRLGYYLTLHPH
jgi:glycosyltransferase involved in cell wall biosynthesis